MYLGNAHDEALAANTAAALEGKAKELGRPLTDAERAAVVANEAEFYTYADAPTSPAPTATPGSNASTGGSAMLLIGLGLLAALTLARR